MKRKTRNQPKRNELHLRKNLKKALPPQRKEVPKKRLTIKTLVNQRVTKSLRKKAQKKMRLRKKTLKPHPQ